MTDFTTSIDRLHRQIHHWETARWAAPAGSTSRADLMYALLQRLADWGADAEGRPRRPMPREADMVLADQLRVVADDLLAAQPPATLLSEATAAVDALRRTI